MRPGLDEVRDRQFGVFTSWQVLCEYTRAEMRARVDRGEWVRVFRGVYREAGTPAGVRLRVEAARLSLGSGAVTAAYSTAAELHGFSVFSDEVIHLVGARISQAKQIVVHRDRVDPWEVEPVLGVSATTAERTAVDIARTVSRADAEATLRAVLRHGVSRDALAAEIGRQEHRLGWGQVVELFDALGHASPPRISDCVSRIDLRATRGKSPYPATHELGVELREAR
ncbi:hypothetical protein [Nocardia sp. NPDC050435]|uniref:hypothetical protein n=1 Tax=Nocardia sp. NPDC050435 TaxID=3155040 RepID=UPI0033E931B9